MDNYSKILSDRFNTLGFVPEQPWQRRGAVAISENGKTYRVSVGKGVETAVYSIDGGVLKDGYRCDKLLLALAVEGRPQGGTVFVELKGKDIEHAVEQLESTIKNKLFKPYPTPNDGVRARIVTAGCGPKSSSRAKIEEARIRFKKLYNIELKILKNGQPDTQLT